MHRQLSQPHQFCGARIGPGTFEPHAMGCFLVRALAPPKLAVARIPSFVGTLGREKKKQARRKSRHHHVSICLIRDLPSLPVQWFPLSSSPDLLTCPPKGRAEMGFTGSRGPL